LRAQRRGQQRYGTITLSVPGMPKRQYAVPIHKVMAYALWGNAAFVQGVHVRHLDGNSENNRRENLALGSAAENEADKPRSMKVRVARAARAAQASPHNARFTYYEVISIREHCELQRTKTGRIKRGVVKKLAEHYQVTAAAISAIAVGKNYAG
jgi:HNH endonuclease